MVSKVLKVKNVEPVPKKEEGKPLPTLMPIASNGKLEGARMSYVNQSFDEAVASKKVFVPNSHLSQHAQQVVIKRLTNDRLHKKADFMRIVRDHQVNPDLTIGGAEILR